MADNKKLRAVMAVVEDETRWPKGVVWDQSDWVYDVEVDDENGKPMCGTALCFAGWCAYLDGYTQPYRIKDTVMGTREITGLENPDTGIVLNISRLPAYAADSLGISRDDAAHLFEGGNDLETLQEMVANLADGKDVWGDELPSELES